MNRKPIQPASKTLLADLAKIDMPEPPAPNPGVFRHLGYRDALVNMCVTIRLRGVLGAVRDLAVQVNKMDPDNPHAKWLLSNYHKFRITEKQESRALIVIPQTEQEAQRKAA